MALLTGLGQAATVAQLVGVDASGLISMIVQAVRTVNRNKGECRELARRVMMIGDLLQQLQGSEMMQRPEIRRPLDGLDDTLRQAYMLVTSCQESNILYRFFMAANQANQFREVQNKIDSYLLIFPVVSYIDITRRLDGLYGSVRPPGSQPQASEEVVGSFSSHSSPDSRTEEIASDDIESVGVPAATEQFAVEVCQQDDRRHRFRWLVWWARRETTSPIDRLIGHGGTAGFTVFKFSQLAASTNNFSSENKIGQGGYGFVYKGQLPNGLDVAIKINSAHTSGRPDFEKEVQIISNLQHANIVKLLGCCIKGDKKILVYEYMPNGSLNSIIERGTGVWVDWPTRFRIIKGIAQGAVYLHQHSRPRVIHRDLKPSNILLDHDMTPRISDFGIAEVLSSDADEKETVVAGTLGYLDPECLHSGTISTASDLYTFGVTLLGIITTRLPIIDIDSLERRSLVDYAWESWSTGRDMELIDPSLHDEPGISEILRCIQIALLCVQAHRADRPTMSDVLLMLSCGSIALPVPNPPWQRTNERYIDDDFTGTVSDGTAEDEAAEQ